MINNKESLRIVENSKMPNYQNGRIYSIRSYQTDLVYIGSTTQKLTRRFNKHKSSKKFYEKGKSNYMTSYQLLDFDDAYIELIELCPCNLKEELHRREGEIIRGTECVNKIISGRTNQQYREDNKIKIAERHKIYHNDNSEKISKQKKKYYDDNKVKIDKRNKLYRDDNKIKISKHMKEYNQKNRESILVKHKEYYEKNKIKKNAKLNREIINCGCGSNIVKYALKKHEKSKKHLKYISELEV